MAKSKAALGLIGLLVVFVVVLLIGTLFFSSNPVISAFEDMGSECTLGLKPCNEGYFCETNKCIPVSPSAKETVYGYRKNVDLS